MTTVGQGLLIVDVSRLYSYTPRSVELLWTSDQPVATDTILIRERDIHAPGGIRTRILIERDT